MDTILNLNNAGVQEGVLHAVLRKSGRALTAPARFFRTDFPAMNTPTLLAFGIGNAWAAAAFSFFVQTINSLLLTELLDHWMQRLLSSEEGFSVWGLSANSFLFTSGLLLLGPFLFLLQTAVFSVWLFLFARLLIEDRVGAPEPVTFQGALRIQAASLVCTWYSLVPIFGGLLSFIAGLVVTVTGVRERFGVSTRRASAVVLAPYLLFVFGAILLGFLLLTAASQVSLQELFDVDPRRLDF